MSEMIRESWTHLWGGNNESLHSRPEMSKAKTEEGGCLACPGQQGDHVAGAEGPARKKGHHTSPGAQSHGEGSALL